MRMKDEEKQAALFKAAVKTVNSVGFVAASVAKIAKEANVSPATLYIYFDDKEDLLVSTYIEIKKNFSRALLKDFDTSIPVRDILQAVWFSMSDHIVKNPEDNRFIEQFSNSPYHDLVKREMVEKYFTPIIEVLQRGIDEKIIKDVDFNILAAFIFYPVKVLSNRRLGMNCDFEMSKKSIETAFKLAWDAIKL